MIPLLMALLVEGAAQVTPPPATRMPQDSLRDLFEAGATFPEFLEAATHRGAEWHSLYADAHVRTDALARARALGGTWHFLVIAEDWCPDSMNTVPYLARLVTLVNGLDMRVVHEREGRGIMEAHRTPDGRPATPTVILLDGAWREVGSFVERPRVIQDWVMGHRQELGSGEIHAHIFDWYAKDRGATTVGDIVDLLEAARRNAGEAVDPDARLAADQGSETMGGSPRSASILLKLARSPEAMERQRVNRSPSSRR
jgi:hypothetical protein